MSKDAQPSGFLSKMVKFVRHPATSWNDLDTIVEGRDSNYSKQALKEMIERKRRNDFVRKREFDMLRKLRSKTPVGPEQGYGGRPSFFQSSYSSKPDDRAGTLKKIDEIEAQMSRQWWKTKQNDSHQGQETLPPEGMDSAQAYRTTVPVNHPATVAMTVPMLPRAHDLEPTAPAPLLPTEALVPPVDMLEDDGKDNSAYSASKFYALDVQELALDPEIEEASIRFASGDDVATEQGLKETLEQKKRGASTDEWMTLFDFYRATGRLAPFESRAIDFANRFSTSAPQWVSMPEEVAARLGQNKQPSSELQRALWVADSVVDAHAVTLLAKLLARSPKPWVLDWTSASFIQAAAVARLASLFVGWGEAEDADLRFLGARNLRDLLQRMTPSGDRTAEQASWQLRLAALRVMNQADEFEMAALEFCITYEMSPPSWELPRCHFKSLVAGAPPVPAEGAEAAEAALTPKFMDSHYSVMQPLPSSGFTDLQATATFNFRPAAQGELLGEVLGDAEGALAALDVLMGDATVCVISCRNLIRVDFSAAGSILNWVSTHQAQGREIQFDQVHRLIAAFFHVIGITEHAKVLTRED